VRACVCVCCVCLCVELVEVAMAILSGPILVVHSLSGWGRLILSARVEWLNLAVSACLTVLHAGVAVCSFFVPLYAQSPWVG